MKILLFFSLLLCSIANASEIKFGFGMGRTNVELDPTINIDFLDFSPSIGTLSLDIEYIFDSNFMISLHSGNGTDNVIFGAADNTSLYTLDFFTGYVFQKDKLYITPKVGYSNWRIRLREGEFLSSGEEKVSENDGYDFTIGLDAGYKFTDLFGMSISYHHLNFDYGEYNSYLVNFDFFF